MTFTIFASRRRLGRNCKFSKTKLQLSRSVAVDGSVYVRLSHKNSFGDRRPSRDDATNNCQSQRKSVSQRLSRSTARCRQARAKARTSTQCRQLSRLIATQLTREPCGGVHRIACAAAHNQTSAEHRCRTGRVASAASRTSTAHTSSDRAVVARGHDDRTV